jgi:hypothetical protein
VRKFAGDPATRALAQSRTRRLRHAQTWDGITDEEILQRDGWRCQIPGCNRRPIRKDLRFPHPRSKSIDHIVPLSLGGDDTAANKRAAHLKCNIARSANAGDEQIALFGSLREPPLVTRTVTGAVVKVRRRKPCVVCGNEKPPRQTRCNACQQQREAAIEQRLQAVRNRLHEAEERRKRKTLLIAQVEELRARGLPTRVIAAKLGTSHRMVIRIGLRDPVTGLLPR